MAQDVIEQMEQEQKRAAQRSSGNGPTFFVLKDKEKALVRPLLDLNHAVVIHKHDLFDQATKRYTVNALCSKDVGFADCRHCADAEKNKKLKAVTFFLVPVWVYKVLSVQTGKPVTYTDADGNESEISGVRYLQLKASSPILANLLSFYREEGSILKNDFVIERKGESLDTTYTVIPKQPKPFAPGVDVPAQDGQEILMRLIDLCPYAVIDDNAPSTPAVVSNGKGKPIDDDF